MRPIIPGYLQVGWVKHQFSFILEIDQPIVNSVAAVAKFLAERKLHIHSITVAPEQDKTMMAIHCHLEKDRLKHTMHLLSMVRGVLKIDLAT